MSLQHPRKIVSLAVMACFFGLVYLSALPVQAASAPAREETVSPVDSQTDLPGAVEKTGSTAPKKKGSPIIPIIIGVVAVGAIAAVLVLVVFKSYDITGNWTMTELWDINDPDIFTITFSGDKKTGSCSSGVLATGTYSVDGKNVVFNLRVFSVLNWAYTGTFKGKDKLEGSVTFSEGGSASWSAVRTSGAASIIPKKIKQTIH